MKFYIAILAVVFLSVFLVQGCDSGHAPVPIPEPEPETIYQGFPTWLTEDLILFENHELPGGASNPDSVEIVPGRICALSISTKQVIELGLLGTRPSGQVSLGKAVWFSPDHFGSIVMGDLGGWEEIVGPPSSGWRAGVCLSKSGAYVAWQTMGADSENGLWVLNLQSGTRTFLGSGHSPAWHPFIDIVVYSGSLGGGSPAVLACSGPDWEPEIVGGYPNGVFGSYLSFSPNGQEIAFSNSGSPSDDGVWTNRFGFFAPENRIPCSVKGLDWGLQGIIFGTGCSEELEPGCGRLWVVDPENWTVEQLTGPQ